MKILKVSFLALILILAPTWVAAQVAVNLDALIPITPENATSVEVLINLVDGNVNLRYAAISPDGTLLAYFTSGTTEDTFRVVALDTGEVLNETIYAKGDRTAPDFLNFTPDNHLIFLQRDGLTKRINLASGEVAELGNFVIPVDFSAYSGYSTGVTLNMDEQVVYLNLWDEVGTPVFEQALSASPIALPAISDDGSRFAIALADGIYVMEVASPVLDTPLIPISENVSMLAFSPDGTMLASVNNDSYDENPFMVHVYDVPTGDVLYSLDRNEAEGGLDFVAFSPDGSLLYFTEYNLLMITDAITGERLLRLPVMEQGGHLAAFGMNADGRLLIAGANNSLSLIGIPAQ